MLSANTSIDNPYITSTNIEVKNITDLKGKISGKIPELFIPNPHTVVCLKNFMIFSQFLGN